MKYVIATALALSPFTLFAASASADGPHRPAVRHYDLRHYQDRRHDHRHDHRHDYRRHDRGRDVYYYPRSNWYRYDSCQPQGFYLNQHRFGYNGSGFSFSLGR